MSTSDDEVVGEAVITNPQGLHARPVMRFIDLAATFAAQITVERAKPPSERVDGKSPMQMMLLCATCGTPLRIRARGTDAREAVEALVGLINRQFDQNIHA